MMKNIKLNKMILLLMISASTITFSAQEAKTSDLASHQNANQVHMEPPPQNPTPFVNPFAPAAPAGLPGFVECKGPGGSSGG